MILSELTNLRIFEEVESRRISSDSYLFGSDMVPCHQCNRKVQVGKDQEKAQSEKDSHSKNRGGKKPN